MHIISKYQEDKIASIGSYGLDLLKFNDKTYSKNILNIFYIQKHSYNIDIISIQMLTIVMFYIIYVMVLVHQTLLRIFHNYLILHLNYT